MEKKTKLDLKKEESRRKEMMESVERKVKWRGASFFIKEFEEHLPFAIFASALALVAVILFSLFGYRLGEHSFEYIHFIHLFFSAAATAMVYHRYKNGFIRGILVGIVGAIILGSLSDVLFPYSVVSIFRFPALFHLPLLEEPLIVIGISALGSVFGQVVKKNYFNHSIHVFLSVFASLFYLVNYVVLTGIFAWTVAFLILVLTVWLPCCLSDLAFPLLFVGHKHS